MKRYGAVEALEDAFHRDQYAVPRMDVGIAGEIGQFLMTACGDMDGHLQSGSWYAAYQARHKGI
jgi:hypothetical protein